MACRLVSKISLTRLTCPLLTDPCATQTTSPHWTQHVSQQLAKREPSSLAKPSRQNSPLSSLAPLATREHPLTAHILQAAHPVDRQQRSPRARYPWHSEHKPPDPLPA